MTRAVDVGVVAVISLVLDVGRRNGDTALALFGSLVNGAILEVLCVALLCLSLGDGCCEGCLGGVSVSGLQDLRPSHERCTFPWSTWPMVPTVNQQRHRCMAVMIADIPMFTCGLSRVKAA